MPRYRKFLDIDVLTAAKQRIEEILDTHDTPVVLFSGGKDSLVVLHLVLEAVKRRGAEALDVVFWDEELIPDCVIDFVDGYRQRPDIRMVWLGLPMLSQKYILGKSLPYIQWDPNREWIRPRPEWAVTEGDGREVYDQTSLNSLIASRYAGKVAMFNGIRALESLVRHRGVVGKLIDPAVCKAPGCPTASFCRPIYDWSEDDVFKFFYDNDIPYCPIYDWQILTKTRRRVATPLTCEGAKVLEKMRAMDPDYYDRVMRAFPEALVNKYQDEIDREKVLHEYGRSYIGVRRWIMENVGAAHKTLALTFFHRALRQIANRPKAYHPVYLLKWAMGGGFHRNPVQLTDAEYDRLKEKYG